MKENEIAFTEGGLVHILSAAVHLIPEYEIEVLCPNPPGESKTKEINWRGVKIICLSSAKWIRFAQYGNFNFFREAFKYIKKSKPDVLIGNNLLASFLISLLPFSGKKIGIFHHLYLALFPKKKISPFIWLLGIGERFSFIFLKRLDRIGIINPLVGKVLIEKGFSKDKIFFVGNGVNLELYSFSEKKVPYFLIYIGRLAELKGVEELIEVIAEVKKEIPEITLHIVGNGPKYFDLKKKVQKLGVEKNVLFHGYLNEKEKIKLLQNSSLYLSASQFEGFNIPLIEAMATGCVPIVSNIYAHRFVLQDQPVGYLVENKEEMIKKILELVRDENKRLSLAKQGLVLVKEKWTLKKVGQNYKRMLQLL